MNGIMISNFNYNETPVRSKASPRSSPSASIYSRPSSESLPESCLESHIIPDDQKGSPRGRITTTFGAEHRQVSCSTSNRSAGPSSVDFGDPLWRERLTSRDLTAEPEEFLDSLLEPCPKESVRTMTEILHPTDTLGSSVDISGFGTHRDTFAILGLHHARHSNDLPFYFFHRLVLYIDFETYLAVRLCCHDWSKAISHARPLRVPAVSVLPAELLAQIYKYLCPIDFNAARHTCGSWMTASLDWRLLTEMLKRGHWWTAAEADMAVDEILGFERLTLSDEWLLSKRLSTECSLRPDWTGDGVDQFLDASWNKSYDRTTPTAGRHNPTSITLVSEVDFSELGNVYRFIGIPQHHIALGFTVGIYNKFLLVYADCTIYVYSLENRASTTAAHKGAYLEFLISINCPYPVLAVTMDTSQERFSIAALLEGRMGLVYNLYDDVAVRRTRPPALLHVRAIKSEMWDHKPFRCCNHRADTEQDLPGFKSTIGGRALPETSNSAFTSTLRPDRPAKTPPKSSPSGIRRRLLSNICSQSFPPLSIAICPQRRCVAFGCATGIQLHWADDLSGQILTRWVPITTNSDVLHFMPQRLGVDPTNQVRLVTSATNAPSEEAMAYRQFLSRTRSAKEDGGKIPDFDQAVPLSDGLHILFTCPGSGELSIGREVPPAVPGEPKLITRAVLLGPRDKHGKGTVPRIYKAAAELRWGVRVVVGYADTVWLFCVSPDLFFFGTECEQCGDEEEDKENLWPLRIHGIEIGTVRSLSEVTIDADGGGITVWAFGGEGKAYMYQHGDGRNREIRKRVVLRSGKVVDEEDVDGDVYMRDTEESSPPERADSFEIPSPGSYGIPFAAENMFLFAAEENTQPIPFKENVRVYFFTAAGPLPLLPIDDDRDTLMADAPALEDEGYVSETNRSDTPMPDAPAYEEDEDEGYVSAEEEQEDMKQACENISVKPPKRRSEEGAEWLVSDWGRRSGEAESEREGQVWSGQEGVDVNIDVLWEWGLEVEVLGG